eukprot:scaffold402585_cov23-Prasinocladus_malaysianus.AAC.1
MRNRKCCETHRRIFYIVALCCCGCKPVDLFWSETVRFIVEVFPVALRSSCSEAELRSAAVILIVNADYDCPIFGSIGSSR